MISSEVLSDIKTFKSRDRHAQLKLYWENSRLKHRLVSAASCGKSLCGHSILTSRCHRYCRTRFRWRNGCAVLSARVLSFRVHPGLSRFARLVSHEPRIYFRWARRVLTTPSGYWGGFTTWYWTDVP